MHTNLELTYRGRVLLLLGILATFAAWVNQGNSVRLAAAMLTAPLLIDLLWGGRRLPDLRLILQLRRTENGVPFEETFMVENLSRHRAAVNLHLREPRTATFAGGLLLQRLEPGERESLRVPARTRSRGRLQTRTAVLQSHYPLGLIQRQAVLRCRAELISEPARMPLPAHVMEALLHEEPEALTPDTLGEEEFHSMREYCEGEDARFVHALRSASSGTLVRRVLRSQQQLEACLVLDLRRPPGRSAELGTRRLEWSLGATARLVDYMVQRGTVLTCLVLAEAERLWVLRNADDAMDFLTFLAEARPVLHRQVSFESLEEKGTFETCLWVPAGGFKATNDRAALDNPVLVTEWEPL